MINDRLKTLNEYEIDPELLDRTLEFSEALNALSAHPGIRTSAGIDDSEYMMEAYKEYLEESNENVNLSLL